MPKMADGGRPLEVIMTEAVSSDSESPSSCSSKASDSGARASSILVRVR